MKTRFLEHPKIVYICTCIVMSAILCVFLPSCFNNQLGDYSKNKIERIVAKECPLGCTVDTVINFGLKHKIEMTSLDSMEERVQGLQRNAKDFSPPPAGVYSMGCMARSTWRWYSIVHTDYQISFFFDKNKRLLSTYIRPCYTGP